MSLWKKDRNFIKDPVQPILKNASPNTLKIQKKNSKIFKDELKEESIKNPSCVRPIRNPGSSLIRRARLIRRRTTSKYCEKMKNLNEDEAVVVTQILYLRLKTSQEATPEEIRTLNGLKSAYVPYIEYAVPRLDSDDHKFPPPLFFPDFTQPPRQKLRDDQICQYTVVLTDERGNRTFAYCFKYQIYSFGTEYYVPKPDLNPLNYGVVVLTAAFPVENLLRSMAEDLIRTLRRDPSLLHTICSDIMQLRLTSNYESIKNSQFVVPHHRGYTFAQKPTTEIVEKLGVENIVFIFLSLLAEKRVIVTGSDVVTITEAVQSLVKLLSPLEWPHTLIPIVPDTHVELAYNPTPYICGMMRYNLNTLKDIICSIPGTEGSEDITIIDLERGVVLPSLPLEAIQNMDTRLKALVNAGRAMGFPKKYTVDLVTSLKGLFPRRCSEEKFGFMIEKRIMIWYAELFGHYKTFSCGANILTAKNKKRFVKLHPAPDAREFLQWFVESGIFQAFLYTPRDSKYVNGALPRFYEILAKHTPPLRGRGTRNKARAFVWRLFHR